VCVSCGGWEGDSPSKWEKPKATKMLKKRGAYPPSAARIVSLPPINDHLPFQLAIVIPIIAKIMRPIIPNNEKEIVELKSLGKAPFSPCTRKLMPSVMTNHRPIFSIRRVDCARLGLVKILLSGFMPRNGKICRLKIPTKIRRSPRMSQIGNMLPALRTVRSTGHCFTLDEIYLHF